MKMLDECIKLAGEQTEVEPVAWMFIDEYGPSNGVIATRAPKRWDGWKKVPLYAHPPKPSGLSDEVIAAGNAMRTMLEEWANGFEAKHMIEQSKRAWDAWDAALSPDK